MTLGYRSILTADPEDSNLDRIQGALRNWVTSKKGYRELPVAGTLTNASGATLSASQFNSSDGRITSRRWTLVEEWAPPSWYRNTATARTGVTTITLTISPGRIWLWVDVEPPTLTYPGKDGREIQEVQTSGRPAFVQDILRAVHMRDGSAEPLAEFTVVDEIADVERLAIVLSDTERIGAVLVTAAPDGTDTAEWAGQMTTLVGQFQGMAIGFALTPAARLLFNSKYGNPVGTWVAPGAIRTFLPGASFVNPQDSYRHKQLSAATIRDSNRGRIQRILRNAQLNRLNAMRIPEVLREADYGYLREERLRPFEALRSDRPGVQASEDALVWMELAETVEAEVNRALAEIDVLRTRNTNAEALIESLQLDDEIQYGELTKLRAELASKQREIEFLRKELSNFGAEGAASAWSFEDVDAPSAPPESFAELLDRVRGLSGVRFTGKTDEVLELDEFAELGPAAVSKAWDALITFDSYVRARTSGEFNHSLSNFVTHQTHGFPVQIGQVVWSESETVKNNEKFRSQRMLPVAPEVDASGKTLMVAHLKLSNLTGVAPRMYFHDSYSSVGYVTVGYLGSHMDNTKTN